MSADLQLYYKYVFPSHFMWKWLFGVDNNSIAQTIYIGDDKHSFNTAHEFTQYLIQNTNNQSSIYLDIKNTTNNKFLVYFIDISTYPTEIRPCCCQQDKICSKCWIFMVAAMVIVKHKLESMFGFDDITFFYDGDTGIYCFAEIKKDNDIPSSVIDACFTFGSGGDHLHKGFKYITDERNKLHHYIVKDEMPDTLYYEWQMLDILFREYCVLYGLFVGQKGYNELIDFCIWNKFEHSRLKSMYIHTKIQDRPNEKQSAWPLFVRNVNEVIRTANPRYPVSYALKTCCYALVFYFLYPRVSACHSSANFSCVPFPFSINKKTGKLVVPVTPSLDEFKLEHVPDLTTIVKELKKEDEEEEEMSNWRETSVCMFIKELALAS